MKDKKKYRDIITKLIEAEIQTYDNVREELGELHPDSEKYVDDLHTLWALEYYFDEDDLREAFE